METALEALRVINRASDPQWLTSPQTRELGIVIGEFNKPRPALLLSIDLANHAPIMSKNLAGNIDFTLHVLGVVDMADHGNLVYDMESDVRKAFLTSTALNALVYGVMRESRSGFSIEAMKASGMGVLDTQFVGQFRFNADTM